MYISSPDVRSTVTNRDHLDDKICLGSDCSVQSISDSGYRAAAVDSMRKLMCFFEHEHKPIVAVT